MNKQIIRFSISTGFLIVLILAFSLLGYAQKKDLKEVEQLKDDIHIINLLNSLDLRKEQKEFIRQKAREAGDIRSGESDQISAYKAEALQAYTVIKQEVEAGRVTVDKDDSRKFHEVKEQVEDIVKNAQGQIDKIAGEVERQLEPFQIIALDGYKPCVIPIMTEGRIGQSGSASGIVKILERIQAVPELQYNLRKDMFVERLMERIKKKAPPRLQLDEEKIRACILKTFEDIRQMESDDFLLKKDSIAEELSEEILPAKNHLSRKEKIERFLLAENVIPILEKSLQ
ncbi:MAG: hypothetical protein V2A64_02595 [Candidatus Omnitrophota bacterium]